MTMMPYRSVLVYLVQYVACMCLCYKLPVRKNGTRSIFNCDVGWMLRLSSEEIVENDISLKRLNIITMFLLANYKQRSKHILLYVYLVRLTSENFV